MSTRDVSGHKKTTPASPKGPRQQLQRISHKNFHRLCMWLPDHKDALARQHTSISAARYVSEQLDFPVAVSSLKDACEVCGVPFPARTTSPSGNGGLINHANFRILAQAVVDIANQLGGVKSDAIAELQFALDA